MLRWSKLEVFDTFIFTNYILVSYLLRDTYYYVVEGGFAWVWWWWPSWQSRRLSSSCGVETGWSYSTRSWWTKEEARIRYVKTSKQVCLQRQGQRSTYLIGKSNLKLLEGSFTNFSMKREESFHHMVLNCIGLFTCKPSIQYNTIQYIFNPFETKRIFKQATYLIIA